MDRDFDRALVLGGAGFLGGWVTRELEALGVDTRVLGYGASRRGDVGLAITRESVSDIVSNSNSDAVFFLAGSASVPRSLREPAQDLRENAGLVIEVLEGVRLARPSAILLFASSAAVYGDSQADPMSEDHPLLPKSPYGISKLAAEHYVRLYASMYAMSAVTVRPFSVYGPGQRKMVVYDLIGRLLSGENPLTVESPPEVARDFVYVQDAARALIELARRAPAAGEVYNIASGVATTLETLTSELADLAGNHTTVEFTGRLREGDPFRWRGDPSRAASLGVRCDTPLGAGLASTYAWIRGEIGR